AQDDDAAVQVLRELRRIDLEMPTTSLGHARPYRMPTHTSTFFFKPEELRAYLPERVVAWMEAHARTPGGSERRTFALLPQGLLALPHGADLPVGLAARVSLSFPFVPIPTRPHLLC